MKLRLLRKAQARSCVEWPYRRPIHPADLCQSSALRGLQLLIENVSRFPRGHEQIPGEPLKIALDLLLGNDSLDALDGCRMALGSLSRAFRSVCALEVGIAIVESGDQMGRGPG